MKIAITGYSEGIGKSFANILSKQGHEIVGLSRRNGHNIRSLNKIIGPIVECDMFINNAQVGFAQTELLYKVWQQWHDQPKTIWNIGSMISLDTDVDFDLEEYKLQKQTLDQAHYNLLNQEASCQLFLIRPGTVATQQYNDEGVDSANVNAWVSTICETWNIASDRNLKIEELNLGFGTVRKL